MLRQKTILIYQAEAASAVMMGLEIDRPDPARP